MHQISLPVGYNTAQDKGLGIVGLGIVGLTSVQECLVSWFLYSSVVLF